MAVNDPHTDLSEKLGITRDEAKLVNHTLCYQSQPLGANKGVAFSIMRCHEIARIFPTTHGAAKMEKWTWLTQKQPFDVHVAIQTIRKFLPDLRELNRHHPLFFKLGLMNRLKKARDIAAKATDETHLAKIEELLRPMAFILEKEGHRVYE